MQIKTALLLALLALAQATPATAADRALYPYCFVSDTPDGNLGFTFEVSHRRVAEAAAKGLRLQGPRYYCGYIDLGGAWVIKPTFVSAMPFSNGLASVETETDGWRRIDRKGALVAEPRPPAAGETVSDLGDGLVEIRIGNRQDGWKYGVLDTTGKWVAKPEYGRIDVYDGRLIFLYPTGRLDESFQVVNRAGEPVGPGWLQNKKAGSGGPLLVSPDYDGRTGKGKWGVLDSTGRTPFKAEFDAVGTIANGYAAVANGGKWGLIDRTGQFVVPPVYAAVGEFSEGWVGVLQAVEGRSALDAFYVNLRGERLDGEKLKRALRRAEHMPEPFHDGLVRYETEGCGIAYMDTTGNFAIPCRPGSGSIFQLGIASYGRKANNLGKLARTPESRVLVGYIDRTGRWVIGPFLNVKFNKVVDKDVVSFQFFDGRPELPYRYYRRDGTELVPPGVKPRPIVDIRPFLQ